MDWLIGRANSCQSRLRQRSSPVLPLAISLLSKHARRVSIQPPTPALSPPPTRASTDLVRQRFPTPPPYPAPACLRSAELISAWSRWPSSALTARPAYQSTLPSASVCLKSPASSTRSVSLGLGRAAASLATPRASSLGRQAGQRQADPHCRPGGTQLHGYGTGIEGEWSEVFKAIEACHEAVHAIGCVSSRSLASARPRRPSQS